MNGNEAGLPRTRRRRKAVALLGVAAAVIAVFGVAPPQAQAAPPEPPDGPPYRVGGEVTRPVRLSGAEPAYTEAARLARVTGIVILEAVIDEHGAMTNPRVLKGLPMGLDAAAIDAVKTWKFTPAMLHGKPVPVYFVVTVNFQLTSDFNFGPAYSRFLADHAEVRELVDAGNFGGAGELLDRWAAERPDDDGIRLMRAYMHLGEGDVPEAWRVARSVSGAEQAEVAESIAAKAAEELEADSTLPTAERAEIVEAGLAAAAAAIDRTSDDDEFVASVLRTEAELLRRSADLTTDAAQREALLDEAAAADARADELRPAEQIFH